MGSETMTVPQLSFHPDRDVWMPLPSDDSWDSASKARWLAVALDRMVRSSPAGPSDAGALCRRVVELVAETPGPPRCVFFPIGAPHPVVATVQVGVMGGCWHDHVRPRLLDAGRTAGSHCVDTLSHPQWEHAWRTMRLDEREHGAVTATVAFIGEWRGYGVLFEATTVHLMAAGQFAAAGRVFFDTFRLQ